MSAAAGNRRTRRRLHRIDGVRLHELGVQRAVDVAVEVHGWPEVHALGPKGEASCSKSSGKNQSGQFDGSGEAKLLKPGPLGGDRHEWPFLSNENCGSNVLRSAARRSPSPGRCRRSARESCRGCRRSLWRRARIEVGQRTVQRRVGVVIGRSCGPAAGCVRRSRFLVPEPGDDQFSRSSRIVRPR